MPFSGSRRCRQGGSYSAKDKLAAGYGMLQLYLTGKHRAARRGRGSRGREVTVVTQPTVGASVTTKPDYTDVLPSLSL